MYIKFDDKGWRDSWHLHPKSEFPHFTGNFGGIKGLKTFLWNCLTGELLLSSKDKKSLIEEGIYGFYAHEFLYSEYVDDSIPENHFDYWVSGFTNNMGFPIICPRWGNPHDKLFIEHFQKVFKVLGKDS